MVGIGDANEKVLCARVEGFVDAGRENGLSTPEVLEFCGDVAEAAARLKSLLARPAPPTAICAYSDLVAMVVIAAACLLGHEVTDQLAVNARRGVDDIEAARYNYAPATTV